MKKNKNNFADDYIIFVWLEESTKYFELGLVISCDTLFWNLLYRAKKRQKLKSM